MVIRRARCGGPTCRRRSAQVPGFEDPLSSFNRTHSIAAVQRSLALGKHHLPEDSVANASQVIAIDKDLLTERVGKLTRAKLELIFAGLDAILGR